MSGRVGILMCVVSGFALLFSSNASIGASHAFLSEGGFCRSEVVPSGMRWIQLMDPIPHVKVEGDSPWGPTLPFGPEALRLEVTPHVTDRHDRLGFSLNWIESAGEVDVAWDVAARFARVNRFGRIRKGTERTKRVSLTKVGAGSSMDFRFGVGAQPAFYRADIEVIDRDSERRAHYAQYFRVVEREYDVRLALDRSVYRPGDYMLMRLRNFGTVGVSYGYSDSIERYEGGGWVLDPSSQSSAPLPRLTLPGGSGECMGARLCIDRPGLYRVTKEVDLDLPGHVSREVRKQFWIVPSPEGTSAAERSERCWLEAAYGKP